MPRSRLVRWPGTERPRRTRRAAIALIGLTLAAAPAFAEAGAGAGALAFSRHGQPVASRSLAALQQIAEPKTIRVFEPYEAREVGFHALPLAELLDAIYSPSWRNEQELLFTCSDGYQPTLPVERVTRHRAWLAFDRIDEPGFSLLKQESGERKRIQLGPFYLIWENLDDPKILQEADYGWPYQLVGVDLIRTVDRFPRLMPPQGTTRQVRAGFNAFRIHCSKCHALNGEGGAIGPELNAASSPLETRDREWLRRWIVDPSSIRENARMPALNPALPDREQTVDAILAYLQAMRLVKEPADGE